ncbi:hypothetical protein PG993_009574 [Apiospora rasikravindrae]|uniref:Uncharacterized protein n=1 Tax=Apiospora rasikravindrae TaxID=990691 RepID=A0ABR1SLK1_9PEZI
MTPYVASLLVIAEPEAFASRESPVLSKSIHDEGQVASNVDGTEAGKSPLGRSVMDMDSENESQSVAKHIAERPRTEVSNSSRKCDTTISHHGMMHPPRVAAFAFRPSHALVGSVFYPPNYTPPTNVSRHVQSPPLLKKEPPTWPGSPAPGAVSKLPVIPGRPFSNAHSQSPRADVYTGQRDPLASPEIYDTSKPTCSLDLVCYRAGSGGCNPQQIQCTLRSRTIEANPSLISTDDQLFSQMKRIFEKEIRGFIRRRLSLKTLKSFRVLAADSYTT